MCYLHHRGGRCETQVMSPEVGSEKGETKAGCNDCGHLSTSNLQSGRQQSPIPTHLCGRQDAGRWKSPTQRWTPICGGDSAQHPQQLVLGMLGTNWSRASLREPARTFLSLFRVKNIVISAKKRSDPAQ